MKILFAGGGTAGHINPALSIANIAKKKWPQAEIRFAGNPSGMEFKLVPQAGYEIFPINIRGFRRKLSVYNLGTLKLLAASLRQAEGILNGFKPDLVVGTGGYVSGPVLYKAAKMHIPTAIHEQNSYPGMTTKILSRYVDKIMVTSEDCIKYLKSRQNIVITGMPVREEFIYYKKSTARKELKIGDEPVVLSYGGSLGAHRINEAVCDFIAETWKGGSVHHIHATGSADYKWFMDEAEKKGIDVSSPNLDIREYIDDMPRCFAAADIVICRSGASTLSELEVQAKPSVLIPSPNVTANHQYYNALSLSRRGAAVLVKDADLTGTMLCKTVRDLLDTPEKLDKMGRAAGSMAVFDVNQRIIDVLSSIVG